MSNEFSADDFVESIIQDSIHGPEYADEVTQLRATLAQALAERDAATRRAEQAEAVAARVDELTRWAAGLVEYRRRAGAINFQLEKADDYIRGLENAIAALAGPEGGRR